MNGEQGTGNNRSRSSTITILIAVPGGDTGTTLNQSSSTTEPTMTMITTTMTTRCDGCGTSTLLLLYPNYPHTHYQRILMLLWPFYVRPQCIWRESKSICTYTDRNSSSTGTHTGTGNRGWRRQLRLTDGVIITSHHTRVLPEKSWKISGQHCVNGLCV